MEISTLSIEMINLVLNYFLVGGSFNLKFINKVIKSRLPVTEFTETVQGLM